MILMKPDYYKEVLGGLNIFHIDLSPLVLRSDVILKNVETAV